MCVPDVHVIPLEIIGGLSIIIIPNSAVPVSTTALGQKGAQKIRLAPAERTATRTGENVGEKSSLKKLATAFSSNQAVPSTPDAQDGDEDHLKLDPEDFGSDVPRTDEELFAPSDDETDFYKEVNADQEMIENAAHLAADDHSMLALMDTLLCLGDVKSGFATAGPGVVAFLLFKLTVDSFAAFELSVSIGTRKDKCSGPLEEGP